MPNPTTLNFTPADNDLAYKLYQGLLAQEVSLAEMDVGEGAINYTGKTCPDGVSTCLIGAHDGVVTSSEVFEYALNDYEKYRGIIEGTLQSPIPWVLNDLNSATSFDAEIRIRVQSAIDQLKEILKDQGIDEGTEEYKERMAVGIYYLAVLPDAKTIRIFLSSSEYATLPTSVKKMLEMKELTDLGLEKFKDYLKINGGFYLIKGNSEEYTALEAIQKSRGECTENSKILFALLRMGGLDPQFVLVKRKGLLTSGDPEIEAYLKDLPAGMDHFCIGFELRGRFRLLDPSIFDSNADYTEYFPLSLRQYLNFDYSNRGNSWAKKEEYDKAIVDYTRAIEIDPRLAEAYTNRGVAWSNKGEYDKAITDHSKAIEINPQFAEAYSNRGNDWDDKGESDKAIADYTRAIEIDPQLAEAYANLGLALVRAGKLEKALQPLAQFLKFAPEQSNTLSSMLSSNSSTRWNRTTDSKEIAERFETETGRGDISKVEAIFILSYSLWESEYHEEAIVQLSGISDELEFSQKPSKSTQTFFEEMFQLMPESMKEDEKAQEIITKIKSKMD